MKIHEETNFLYLCEVSEIYKKQDSVEKYIQISSYPSHIFNLINIHTSNWVFSDALRLQKLFITPLCSVRDS